MLATARSGLPCSLVLLLAGLSGSGAAQAGLPAIRSASDVDFQLLATAPFHGQYQTIQVRRFLDGRGNLVQLRERLTVDGKGVRDSSFQLEFQDVLPGSGGTGARQRWQNTYQSNAGLLFRHGSFGVRDVAAAQHNYTIHDFGPGSRAGRAVRRVVVFPKRVDKAIYAAEYDTQARLLSEIEVTSFLDAQAMTKLLPGWEWKARLLIKPQPSIQSAKLLLRSQPVTPAVSGIMAEYVQHLVQVVEDPLNGDQTLVLGYSDGIDEFFVIEMFGGSDPFAGLPAMQGNGRHAQAIASYDDPAMRAYVFHAGGVTFQVVGRSSLTRLKDLAYSVCKQAVQG
jgi:hypothetical protein